MKITSTCEKEFISKCIAKNCRLDGRSLSEGRNLEITFGSEWGCCMVSIGNTKVLAQVSAEVTEPKPVTPAEGALHINLELSSMSAPDVQFQSRISDEFVEFQRILERCIRDSKCIDLESLCIISGSKVFTIRVDVHTLNDDGNLVECSSIAAISALAHFKRPEVTILSGNEVVVHPPEDRKPAPLILHHMPISVNLALFQQGEHIVVDPLEKEEKIADGCYIIGMNAHQEICLVHRKGVLLLSSDTIHKCQDIATRRAQVITQAIRKALDDDAYKRATDAPLGFVNMLQTGTILGSKTPIKKVDFHEIAKSARSGDSASTGDLDVIIDEDDLSNGKKSARTVPVKPSQAGIRAAKLLKEAELSVFEGGSSKWDGISSEESSEEEEEDEVPDTVTSTGDFKKEKDSNSEDDEIVISTKQLDVKPSSTRGWYSNDPFA